MSAAALFAGVKVGDRVQLVQRGPYYGGAIPGPYTVVEVTGARFTVEQGINPYTGGRMTATYRKLDGRSVGYRRHITFVQPLETAKAGA